MRVWGEFFYIVFGNMQIAQKFALECKKRKKKERRFWNKKIPKIYQTKTAFETKTSFFSVEF